MVARGHVVGLTRPRWASRNLSSGDEAQPIPSVGEDIKQCAAVSEGLGEEEESNSKCASRSLSSGDEVQPRPSVGADIKPCAAVSEDLVEEESNRRRKYDVDEVHIQRRKMARKRRRGDRRQR